MLLISLGAATVVLIAFWIFITPKQRKHIEKMRAGNNFFLEFISK
jgi:uncharacterized membrane protein